MRIKPRLGMVSIDGRVPDEPWLAGVSVFAQARSSLHPLTAT